MLVKPKPGVLVRYPDTKEPLPAEGAEVPLSAYWRRRLAAGDVERVGPIPQVSHDDNLKPGHAEVEP